MNFEIVSVVGFLVFLAVMIYRDRKNIEIKSVLFIKRSQSGKKFIYDFSEKHEKILRLIGTIAVIVGFIASIYAVWLLSESTANLFLKLFFEKEVEIKPFKLILPTVTGVRLPGFILGVPFWYWIIGVFTVMFAHEPMHAFLARVEKIKIKSFGVLLLLILPGAFVEPDENQLKKLSRMKKLRIYAAGSFGNFIVGLFFILLTLSYNFVLTNIMEPQGVVFTKTVENSPAQKVNLDGIIIGINSKDVKSISDFGNIMQDVKPGDDVIVKTTLGAFNIQTSSNPEAPEFPFIGIEYPRTYFIYRGIFNAKGSVSTDVLNIIIWFSDLFGWLILLNIGIGIFNLLPAKPLDGGLMFEEVVRMFYKGKNPEKIVNTVSILVLILVLLNLFAENITSLVHSII